MLSRICVAMVATLCRPVEVLLTVGNAAFSWFTAFDAHRRKFNESFVFCIVSIQSTMLVRDD
jgi:hypothetical protein